jgi:hypothetical protein
MVTYNKLKELLNGKLINERQVALQRIPTS